MAVSPEGPAKAHPGDPTGRIGDGFSEAPSFVPGTPFVRPGRCRSSSHGLLCRLSACRKRRFELGWRCRHPGPRLSGRSSARPNGSVRSRRGRLLCASEARRCTPGAPKRTGSCFGEGSARRRRRVGPSAFGERICRGSITPLFRAPCSRSRTIFRDVTAASCDRPSPSLADGLGSRFQRRAAGSPRSARPESEVRRSGSSVVRSCQGVARLITERRGHIRTGCRARVPWRMRERMAR